MCQLDNSPSNPSNNFVMQNCFFRASKLTQKTKTKSLTQKFPGNLASFGAGNSSSRDFWNHKNNSLVLGERPNDDINGSAGKADKKNSALFF